MLRVGRSDLHGKLRLSKDRRTSPSRLSIGAGYLPFGVGELGARLPSALFGAGTALLTARIGWLLFAQATGVRPGLILSSSFFLLVSQSEMADCPSSFSSLPRFACSSRPAGARAAVSRRSPRVRRGEARHALQETVGVLLPARGDRFDRDGARRGSLRPSPAAP